MFCLEYYFPVKKQGGGGGGTKLYAHKLVFEQEWDYGTETFTLTMIMTVENPLPSSALLLSLAAQGKLIGITYNGNEDGPGTQYNYSEWSVDATGNVNVYNHTGVLQLNKYWTSSTHPYTSYTVTEL